VLGLHLEFREAGEDLPLVGEIQGTAEHLRFAIDRRRGPRTAWPRVRAVSRDRAAHAPRDYAGAVAFLLRERVDAMFAALSTPTYGYRQLVADFMRKHRLPGVYRFRAVVESAV
jgi:hypothetical protein